MVDRLTILGIGKSGGSKHVASRFPLDWRHNKDQMVEVEEGRLLCGVQVGKQAMGGSEELAG